MAYDMMAVHSMFNCVSNNPDITIAVKCNLANIIDYSMAMMADLI